MGVPDKTEDGFVYNDRMILLNQLKRYDQKIKQKIEDSASSGTIQATGIAPLNLSVESLTNGGNKIKGSLNIGPGLRVEPQHGLLMPSIDYKTIGIKTGLLCVLDQDLETIEITNQPSTGSVSAFHRDGIILISFDGVKVDGYSKTLVGKISNTSYAPPIDIVGAVLSVRIATVQMPAHIAPAYSKVETDGSVYINPVYANYSGLTWSGTLTYLI
mgnify:FL=1